MTLATCNSFWDGPPLDGLARTCLSSFVRAGHPVRVWCYRDPGNVPEGVDIRDASEFVSPDKMVRHHKGSPSPFTNLFRYELMAAAQGIWIDCDLLCLKPLPDIEYLFGYEPDGWINTAVMRLPAASPIVSQLRDYASGKRKTFPWMTTRQKVEWWLKHTFTNRDIRIREWGFTGPRALTWLVKANGLERHALPAVALNPVPIDALPSLAIRGNGVERFVTADTYCIHLWNKHASKTRPEPGSFLERVYSGDFAHLLA